MLSKWQQRGVTLLEIMLVLAIAASLMVLSLRMYYYFKKDSDYRSLNYNVDLLFNAAKNYYYSQCMRSWDPATGPIATATSGVGALDPNPDPSTHTGASTGAPIAVDFNSNTATASTLLPYLTGNLVMSPLVDYTDTTKSYIVQFNPVNKYRSAQVVKNDGTITTVGDGSANIPTTGAGTITVFTIQISVKLKNPNQGSLVKTYTRGNCLSDLAPSGNAGSGGSGTANYVTTCSTPPPAESKAYVVYERMPGSAMEGVTSDYWVSMPLLNQFKQMYTTYPITNLIGASTNKSSSQYYLCGS